MCFYCLICFNVIYYRSPVSASVSKSFDSESKCSSSRTKSQGRITRKLVLDIMFVIELLTYNFYFETLTLLFRRFVLEICGCIGWSLKKVAYLMEVNLHIMLVGRLKQQNELNETVYIFN